MGEDLVELVQAVQVALASFEPESFSGEECAVLAEELAAIERACAAVRFRAAKAEQTRK